MHVVVNAKLRPQIRAKVVNAKLRPQIRAKMEGIISRGVKEAEIDGNGHLIFTLTDGSTVDLGSVVGPQGEQGEQGETGEQGARGESGVYVGSAQPTDPDIDVWIDPLASADRFVKTVNNVLPDENGNVNLSLAAYRTAAAQDVIDAGKQDAIDDLETIRSGAAAGATAVQSVKTINGLSIAGTGNVTVREVPAVIAADEGKFLRVVSGAAAWQTVPQAEDEAF